MFGFDDGGRVVVERLWIVCLLLGIWIDCYCFVCL